MIYLDYAATTPVRQEAIDELLSFLTYDGQFANSSSQHRFGYHAKTSIQIATKTLAEILHCSPQEIVFTSGATESNNLAIKGIAYGFQKKGKHIITCTTEHKSVLDTCKFLASQGFDITYLKPTYNGLISLEDLENAITDRTILVSIMHVNNETGTVHDIKTIAELCNKKKVFFHVDAAQSFGKIAFDLEKIPVDLLSFSGHKFFAPKGVGGLFVRNYLKSHLTPILHGGGQQFGLRSGTLPTHQIMAMVKAIEVQNIESGKQWQHLEKLKLRFIDELSQLDGVIYNSDLQHSVPYILNVSFEDVTADSLLIALQNDVAIASGSACNSGAFEASYVLRAMGIEGNRLYGAVRISFGYDLSIDTVTYAAQKICFEVSRLRKLALE
jgi:cysteine desulfurase